MVRKKKRYFDRHHKECPFCGKTRRKGYIKACPKCCEFLSEMNLHIKGLQAYMEKEGYSLWPRIQGTTLILSIQVCVKGYVHTVSHNMSLLDIKNCLLPIEETLSKEICYMCRELVGVSKIW